MRLVCLLLLIVNIHSVCGQTRTATTQPLATSEDCICEKEDDVCSCTFVVEHRLTMILDDEKRLVYADNGLLKFSDNNTVLTEAQAERVITADGEGSRLVIAINKIFPGPRIEIYENQMLKLTVINTMHTDSMTIHFHGLHQRGSPWMDGVAFITQCPILPGQSFVYSFKAYPPGTSMYHAHIGDQRSMGLYGPLIVRPSQPDFQEEEIVVTLQDWNHLMDAETAYHRMITEQFDFETGKKIDTTFSVDGGQFSRFEFQSGLINGKGRFWKTSTTHNEAPLERFKITPATKYRFRVIGAMTLYPMRVYIRGERFTLRSSDAYNIERISNVQSVIVHPGERYDFIWTSPGEPKSKEYFLVAETIETAESLKNAKYHAAEAILEMTTHTGSITNNPVNDKTENCPQNDPCITFNCPYAYYPKDTYRQCMNFDDVYNIDPAKDIQSVIGSRVDAEYFFNFAFPGPPGSPGSVNGRGFISPTGSLLTQTNAGVTSCDEATCSMNGICTCTYIQRIARNQLVQMVFLNLGSGSGWSHPVHLHGHSFYVMKMGLGTYNTTTGVLENDNEDINCTDKFGYCSTAAWTNNTWSQGNLPGMNERPPEKDTVVVPTGGYVVIRFVSDNPGMWFLHCHIDLHNTNGMAMVIDEDGDKGQAPPDFPVCLDFRNTGSDEGLYKTVIQYVDRNPRTTVTVLAVFVGFLGFVVIILSVVVYCKLRN